ncbi:hypothetical protein Spla01_02507 [Streptomyces platensis]|uniref:HTH cro/C1-type domain-containing protein n=1 Tax=Streptomyces platensis TaxID=58346 RepID=A0ABX3Y119_STRPT|nr:hypothetical protein BG653_01872 [Streptomyces platensis]
MVENNSGEEEGSARWVLACELRRLREAAGRSLAQWAKDTHYDRTYVHRPETGERFSKRSWRRWTLHRWREGRAARLSRPLGYGYVPVP